MEEPVLRRATLPNGLNIAYATKAELRQFYEDIFERRSYTSHGVSLEDGACVFDVGANIGLFTLFVDREVDRARIFAFEPAPPLFEILAENVRWCRGEVLLFPCGLSDRTGSAELAFYPQSTGLSSFYPDEAEERATLRTLIANELAGGRAGAEGIRPHVEELIEQRLRRETCTASLLTLSGVVREHAVDRIDLLKVDVEKSEEDVLAGIDEAYWPRVRQIAAEVHDIAGRLARLAAQLTDRGFEVQTGQDDLYRGTDRYNLWARRPGRVAGSR